MNYHKCETERCKKKGRWITKPQGIYLCDIHLEPLIFDEYELRNKKISECQTQKVKDSFKW